MRQSRLGQSRRRPQRRSCAPRRRRRAQCAPRRRAGKAWHAGRRNHARRRSRLLPFLCRQQSRPLALQLHRRQSRRSVEDYRRPRPRLDVSRNAVPDLFDSRLQHRACRCDRAPLRRARPSLREYRAIEAVVNWLETEYPSPAFPSRGIDIPPNPGSTQYFTAYGAVTRGYPLLRGAEPGPGETDPPEVLELMRRVTLIPTVRRTLFGPRITI